VSTKASRYERKNLGLSTPAQLDAAVRLAHQEAHLRRCPVRKVLELTRTEAPTRTAASGRALPRGPDTLRMKLECGHEAVERISYKHFLGEKTRTAVRCLACGPGAR
jgi:hypothetical protein